MAGAVRLLSSGTNEAENIEIAAKQAGPEVDGRDREDSMDEDADPLPSETTAAEGKSEAPAPLSKSALKKSRKKQIFEDRRDERKQKRKQKRFEKQERRRAFKAEAAAVEGVSAPSGQTAEVTSTVNETENRPKQASVQVPVTVILDCSFDDLMTETEMVSLSNQLTRCYSDTRKALYRTHLTVSSFSGRMKERYETLMKNVHKNYRGVRYFGEDFVQVAEKSKEWMTAADAKDSIAGALKSDVELSEPLLEGVKQKLIDEAEVVYLSSESPNTLEKLKPYSTYIIGGLVDKNRHKGLCYRRAMNAGVKTARLAIGEYLKMQSRTVLTTNHVNEIILKWLECGDWGEAFLKVIPERKGATLKEKERQEEPEDNTAVMERDDAVDGEDCEAHEDEPDVFESVRDESD